MNLKKILMTLPVTAILSTNSLKTNCQDTINPHIQPNDTNLFYFGSGDINSDNSLNWNDAFSLEDLILNPPQDIKIKDRTRITGNSSTTIQDKKILEGYLKDSLEYLPCHWNKLIIPERENWTQKIMRINKYTPINADTTAWKCVNYSQQLIINTRGTNAQSPPKLQYDFTHNGRFNLPMFQISLQNSLTGFYHEIVGILIGNNIKNFKDWYMIEPQTHKRSYPEKDSRMQGGKIYIDYLDEKVNETYYTPHPFLKFGVEKEKGFLIEDHSGYNQVEMIEMRDTTNLRTTPLYTPLNKIIQKKIEQKFYPNPVSNTGILELNSPENSELEIYNIQGEMIINKKYNSNEIKIDFSKYPNGIYLYKIKQKEKINSGKIIVNKNL